MNHRPKRQKTPICGWCSGERRFDNGRLLESATAESATGYHQAVTVSKKQLIIGPCTRPRNYTQAALLQQGIEEDKGFALAHARMTETWMDFGFSDKAKDELNPSVAHLTLKPKASCKTHCVRGGTVLMSARLSHRYAPERTKSMINLKKLASRSTVAAIVLLAVMAMPVTTFADDPPIIVGGGGYADDPPIIVGGGGYASEDPPIIVGGGGITATIVSLLFLA